MNIYSWANQAEKQLKSLDIESARLDVELILAYTLRCDRTWLHAHSEEDLSGEQARQLDSLLARRLKREPIAYITGKKAFYGREFIVTPDVLIPRPESEDVIELASELVSKLSSATILDVGCGSGCLGITVKLEHPDTEVILCDISSQALDIAKNNASALGADIKLVKSDLLSKFQIPNSKFDVILANLPYVDRSWETSPETKYEPDLALFADGGGMKLIQGLLVQATTGLIDRGYIILEADPCQHDDIVEFAQKLGYKHVQTRGYALGLQLA